MEGVDKNVPPGQDVIPQGIILCNRPGDGGQHPSWMTDGSFLAFRKLKQDVGAWDKFLVDASNQLGTWSTQLASRLIGRWPSGKCSPALVYSGTEWQTNVLPLGCPIELQPDFDNTGIAADPKQINKFEFTPNSNFKCPFGAHIRKMNPRGDLGRTTVSRFRVLRRGIPYGEEKDKDPNGERGLLFVCYQSNLANGFQFLQTRWANDDEFLVEGSGLDAVMGQRNDKKTVPMKGLFPQDASRPLALNGINRFVIPKGGEYFFSPSLSALKTTLSTVKSRSDL